MNLSVAGARLIETFEGFRSHPYLDAVGVPTIGFGSTRGVTLHSPPVSRADAQARLMREVDATYGAAINRLGLPLNQNQFDALVSFVYNVGPGGVASSTTVGKRLRQHDWHSAADALLAWDKAGGRPLAGLTRRRHAERDLFLKPAKPPDPYAGLSAGEKRVVKRYDDLLRAKKKGHDTPAHKAERVRLRAQMVKSRKGIHHAAGLRANGGDGRGWDYAHRRHRYAMLRARTV